MGVAAQNATKEDAQRPNKMLSVSFSLKNQFLNHTKQPQEHLLLGLSSFRFLTTPQPSLPRCHRTPYHAPQTGSWAGTLSALPRSAFGR